VSISIDDYADAADAIIAEIGSVIVGQADLVRDVATCLLAEGHLLLEGVPGLGKTELLKVLGRVTGLEFSRIQFTPDLMPADIVGTDVLYQDDAGNRSFRYEAGPIFAGLVLADEVNRASPKTQAAMLEAMQERSVTVGGVTRDLPRPFLVMATQNPLEMEGTYPLPEAQLDRFMFKTVVPYPSADELEEIVLRTTGVGRADVSEVVDTARLAELVSFTRSVPVPLHVGRYAVDLVHRSQPATTAVDAVKDYVRFGASPRGAQALILGAKAVALMQRRPSVSVEDIRAVAPSALRHRLVLGYEAAADGVAADDIVDALLAATEAPGEGEAGA